MNEDSHMSLGYKNQDASKQSSTAQKQVSLGFTSKTNFIIGWFYVFLMVVPGSLIGPLTLHLPSKNVFVQASWRSQGWAIVSIILLPFIYAFKGDIINMKRDFSLKVLKKNFINSSLLFLWWFGYILGCSQTITSHADIMACSAGVYIFFYSILTFKIVHKLEYFGYVMYTVGVFLMFTDPFATKSNMSGQSYIGDFYAFGGAGAWAIFNILNEGKMNDLHPIVTLAYNNIFSVVFQFLIFPFVVGPSMFLSFDPQVGAFGWLVNYDTFCILIFIIAPVTGIICNLGFFSAYYYFPIEIVSAALLTEPFFAQAGGIILKQDEIPGIKTISGVIIISIGFLLASIGVGYKENTMLKTEHNDIEQLYRKL